jgi:UDP-N-acetylglucosamine 3-dehydrogenase
MNKHNEAHHKSTGNIPRIAIIGCGAFTEWFYLPAFAKHPKILKKLILVDNDAERLQKLAAQYKVGALQTEYQNILDKVDGTIVAVPHQFHHPISMDFLRKGVHVLCEKPLAESVDQAKEMVAQAETTGAILCVNQTQRLFPANIKIKNLLTESTFGKLLYMSYAWGDEFTWPTASGFYFNPKTRKGGVLLDRGAHALDLICWWLNSKPDLVLSENDSFGGIEAVAHIRLKLGNCTIDVNLSWLSILSNSYTIRYELAEIENRFLGWWHIPIKHNSGKTEIIQVESSERNYNDFGLKIVSNFIDVIRKGTAPLIPAREVIPSIELIQECYAKAQRFKLPWYENLEVPNASLTR